MTFATNKLIQKEGDEPDPAVAENILRAQLELDTEKTEIADKLLADFLDHSRHTVVFEAVDSEIDGEWVKYFDDYGNCVKINTNTRKIIAIPNAR